MDQLVDQSGRPIEAPRWSPHQTPACPRCGLYHDPRDHDGEHEHAYPALFESCICGEPHPRIRVRWPAAAGDFLTVSDVRAIATGNLVERLPLARRCPSTSSRRRRK